MTADLGALTDERLAELRFGWLAEAERLRRWLRVSAAWDGEGVRDQGRRGCLVYAQGELARLEVEARRRR